MSNQPAAADFTVPPEAEGERLDVWLTGAEDAPTRSHLQKLIVAGAVLVNGQAVRKNYRVAGGDRISLIDSGAGDSGAPAPENLPLSVLYEDDYCVAVDKPAGIVVHPGNGNRTGTLVNALLYHLGKNISEGSLPERPGIVHRLDKDTSGVLLVAKTNAAHAALAAAFAARSVKKEYLGFCIGVPAEANGVIDISLARSRKDPVKRAADPHGKTSITDFRILSAKSGISLVLFMPRTGRTHQIRVHCSSRGFPILGDALYGGGSGRLLQVGPLDRPFAVKMLACFSRQALHAWKITFPHPFLDKSVTVMAPPPEDFRRALLMMGETDFCKYI
jgi:23S rRNA pseudouridine1911/1915/1917 synthase